MQIVVIISCFFFYFKMQCKQLFSVKMSCSSNQSGCFHTVILASSQHVVKEHTVDFFCI